MNQHTAKRRDFEAQALPQLEGLYRTALCVLDDESDAQELVLESVAKEYRSWLNYQFSPNCRVWLFRIMANVLINKYRPSPSLSAAINDVAEIDGYAVHPRLMDEQRVDDTGQVPFSATSEDQVKKAIRDLPDDFRLIVVLSLLEGFSYQEIADIAGIHLEAVRSRLHQGRKLMQRELLDHLGCEGEYDMPAGGVRSRSMG